MYENYDIVFLFFSSGDMFSILKNLLIETYVGYMTNCISNFLIKPSILHFLSSIHHFLFRDFYNLYKNIQKENIYCVTIYWVSALGFANNITLIDLIKFSIIHWGVHYCFMASKQTYIQILFTFAVSKWILDDIFYFKNISLVD